MYFFKNPNIPNKRAGGVIVDYRISKQSIKTLNDIGIKVLFSCKIPALHESIAGHSDMMLHHFGGNRFISAAESYDYFTELLPDAQIIKGSQKLHHKYPADVLYNVAVFGDFVVCNTACTAIEILSEYKRMGKNILNVNQGYSKCSICIVSENAVITADDGIYKTLIKYGIDVLKITTGHIELKGMSYGFIGGASGLVAPDTLAVNGNIHTHPDSEKIIQFCNKYNVDVLSLNNGPIIDIGSIMAVF